MSTKIPNVEASDWVQPPITDRECIYKCLCNGEQLAGLDRKQVQRLMKQFTVEQTNKQIQSEYPPL